MDSLSEEGKGEVAIASWKKGKSSSAGKDCFESLAQPFTSYMIWSNLIYLSGLLCKSLWRVTLKTRNNIYKVTDT